MKKIVLILSLITLIIIMTNCSSEVPNEDYIYFIEAKVEGVSIGKIKVELWPKLAPKTVHNFDSLARAGAYDGTAFHRVIPGFMIQGGDPNSKNKPKNTWGMGDPSQKKVPAEFSETPHDRGILSMARSQDINSASSQFFIVVSSSRFLDNQYTVFGQVLDGMDIVDKIVNMPRDEKDNPLEKVEMYVTVGKGTSK
jgi:peptidyl-prolyl cis-trans isomerase B (cyclophilin B)